MATTIKAAAQMHMEEQIIADSELVELLHLYVDNQEAHRSFEAARKQIKVKLTERAEGRYRCGPYIIEIEARSGKGLAIPAWKANVFSVSFIE